MNLEKIPVYVRDGAVVPFVEPVQCVCDDTIFQMAIRHYGKKKGSFSLYEDILSAIIMKAVDFGRSRS